MLCFYLLLVLADGCFGASLDTWARSLDSTLRGRKAVFSVIAAPDDWATGGDWQGRYGTFGWVLCGMSGKWDYRYRMGEAGAKVQYKPYLGENGFAGDTVRAWVHWPYVPESIPEQGEEEVPESERKQRNLYPGGMVPWTPRDIRRVLLNPVNGQRRQSSWDDHAEDYRPWFIHKGPDLYINFDFIPRGQFLLSFYFVNKDAHVGANRYREYRIQFKKQEDVYGKKPGWGEKFEAAPVLAESRVWDFYSGVYKRFVVQGPAKLTVRISKEDSINTVLSGIFVDEWTRAGSLERGPEYRSVLRGSRPKRSTSAGRSGTRSPKNRHTMGLRATNDAVFKDSRGVKWRKLGTGRSGPMVRVTPTSKVPRPVVYREVSREVRKLEVVHEKVRALKEKAPGAFLRLVPALANDVAGWSVRLRSEKVTDYHDRLEELTALANTLGETGVRDRVWQLLVEELARWTARDPSLPFAEKKKRFWSRAKRMNDREVVPPRLMADIYHAYFATLLTKEDPAMAEKELAYYANSASAASPWQVRGALLAWYEKKYGKLENDLNFESDRPGLLVGWAFCHERLDQLAVSVKFFKEYLKKSPAGTLANEVRRRLKYLEEAAQRQEEMKKQKFYRRQDVN